MSYEPHLVPAPKAQTGPVKVWSQPLVLPTYEPAPADPNPMFLEKRVFQGSSGKVYPLPFIDRVASEPVDHAWNAVFIENRFIRVIVLPELGGRIYAAIDKINGYDFIYRNHVIKPALVGLAGPWISGGIEFNWPQHHRPSTYMPADWTIEESEDGSRTIWLSEHEPMNRMKGMHGVCLRPDAARIDLHARLYNRTEITQTVMWWANVATDVHEDYQSFFPPDVIRVADHAKRAMSAFPFADGHYYGVDYGERERSGVPASEIPPQFEPKAGYAANDLRWYSNIPVPTSYMCVDTKGAFFGGYDHAAKAGLVHVADRHVSPGKKQWTWGNHNFGYAWDRNLTDPDERGIYRPYIELMAGVYTDNQPDFSFLAPGETKTFTQHWYPIREIGPVDQATPEIATAMTVDAGEVQIGMQAVGPLGHVTWHLEVSGTAIESGTVELTPSQPVRLVVPLSAGDRGKNFSLRILSEAGREILALDPVEPWREEETESASEPKFPREIASADELYVTGLHLSQYRHATRGPELYWAEALKRDPLDSRCNNAMGLWHLRRGEFDAAEASFRKALRRLRQRNPNPYDGEAFYNLGVVLRLSEQLDAAYDAFGKAAWNAAWIAPSQMALAEIDAVRGNWTDALRHVEEALRYGSENLRARALRGFCLRNLGQAEVSDAVFREILTLDPLDFLARDALGQPLGVDPKVTLDLALDHQKMGNLDRALEIVEALEVGPESGVAPLKHYYAAYFADLLGHSDLAEKHRDAAEKAVSDYCFPAQIEEIAILRKAMEANPADARAPYYLGNLLYDKRRYEEAIALWERARDGDPSFSIVWRNLGIAYFNVENDPDKARQAYDRAFEAAPADARVFYERDQLWKRVGIAPEARLKQLEARKDLVVRRDDLCIELAALQNQTGQPEAALATMMQRSFQPWEGGEGMALEQYVRTRLNLGRRALEAGDADQARQHFEMALQPPLSLGEGVHLLANQSDIRYWAGTACRAMGDEASARTHWQLAADFRGDFLDMEVRSFSDKTYFSVLSMMALGRGYEAEQVLVGLERYAKELLKTEAKIDYFATSLPTMLIFEDNIQKRQDAAASIMLAQVALIRDDAEGAAGWLRKARVIDPNDPVVADLQRQLDARKPDALQLHG